MINELIAEGRTKEEIIAIYVKRGFARSQAEFIYAIETAEIDGDVIAKDTASDADETPQEPT